MSDFQRRQIQYEFYEGGVYKDIDAVDVPWGSVSDDAGRTAWEQTINQTALRNASGSRMSVRQVITEITGFNRDARERSLTQTIQGKPVDVTADLTDPAAIAVAADNIASRIMGRKATAEEKRLATAFIHQDEKAQAVESAQAQLASGQQAADRALADLGTQQKIAEHLAQGPKTRTFIEPPAPGETVLAGLGSAEQLRQQETLDPRETIPADLTAPQQQPGVPGAPMPGPSITPITAISPTARLEQFLQENNAAEIDGYTILQVLNRLADRVGLGGGGPTPTVLGNR